ncbi:MAG: FAD:protein FMN transferase [Solirubrobacterales bacterium]|nr:FAD:protein FMN transferase [Solirubrobacterales bacterium]MBV9809840.1 FAD:protein FMN transferase [Solirubrobacterales bacterium]
MGERCTQHVMGTAVTVEIRDRVAPRRALERAFDWLRWVDRTFSTYDAESEVSRLNAGDLALADAHPLVRRVLERCEVLRAGTHGYFDASAPLRGGLDPSGLVKGWAVDVAFAGLRRAGARRLCIEAGGDVRVAGGPWRIGIRNPRRREHLAAVVVLRSGAVATSGAYERGPHVVDPHTGRPPAGTLSVTMIDRTLAQADAHATAAFAMGPRGPAWSARLTAMTILADDEVLLTPTFLRYRA